jgi:uracil-DNA glycosylase
LDTEASTKLSKFCEDVRSCDFCFRNASEKERRGKGTPLVYGGTDPKVLVVSEMPPRSVWQDNEDIGKRWKERELFATTKKVKHGAPHTLCEDWLEIRDKDLKNCFFWIQRANCPVERERKRFAFRNCSSRFLDRAVDLVNPGLILILGRVAAEHFFDFRKLSDMMGQVHKYQESYDCIVLYHPSPANKFRYQHCKRHQDSVALAKQKIEELCLGEYPAT